MKLSMRHQRQTKPLTKILEDRKLKLLGHVLRRDRQHPLHQAVSPQDPRSHGKPNTEDEAAHDNSGQPTIWVKHGKWLKRIKTHDATQPQIPFDKNNRSMRERIIEQAQRYQPPFNKGNPIWNILCESFAQGDTFTQCEIFAQCEVFATREDFFSIIHHQAVNEALGSW